MYNINIRDINPTARYNVTMTAYNDSADVETKTMDGETLIAMINGCAHLYDIDAELVPAEPEAPTTETETAEQTTETTETAEAAETEQGTQDAEQATETAPAAETETETTPAAEPETETTERAEVPEIIARMTDIIEALPARSAWSRAKKEYAKDLLGNLRGAAAYAAETGTPSPLTDHEAVRAALLSGARDWSEYSRGGCALIYDGDIAARVCSPSELRRTHGGQRGPNPRETWLDVQARALYQAGAVLMAAYDTAAREGARV